MTADREYTKRKDSREVVWAIAFLAILTLPLALMPFGSEGIRENEKRTMVPFPSFEDYREFPRSFESWFEDRFGLRSFLIGGYRQTRYELGLWSVGNRKAISGLNDWHYLSGGDAIDTILDYTGALRFSNDEIERLVTYFTEWNRWLVEQGIAFHVLIAPNKVSIYPEYLPSGVEAGPDGVRIEPLLERLADTDISFVYPRDELRSSKSTESNLYFKLDTHWNSLGAFRAYGAFFDATGLSEPYPRSEVRFDKKKRDQGDLTRLLGISSDWQDFDYDIRLSGGDWARLNGEWKFERGQTNRYAMSNAALGKALAFHDSFMGPLVPLFARHFRESVFVYEPHLSRETIQKEKPEVVIFEFAERFSHGLLDAPLPR